MPLAVGESFLLGFRGTTPPAWLREFAQRFGLGGVLLFDRDLEQPGAIRNVESPEQVAALCAALHALDSRPLVFVDQEGGKVRRLKPARGFCDLPSAAEFARLDDREAHRVAAESYAELRRLGIDFNLAPVVDLDTNPDNPNIGALARSFSADPAEVRRCVAILDAAARRVGLGLCLKHYPGLGGAATDSHERLTDISGTVSAAQLRLFTELCQTTAGGAILLSHGLMKEWDAEWPVSVSAIAIGALRERLPAALLITDDLQMRGLPCATIDATLRALGAGADLVCIGNNLRVEEAECFEAAQALASRASSDAPFARRLSAARERIRARKLSAATSRT